jgi:hypothetical protein
LAKRKQIITQSFNHQEFHSSNIIKMVSITLLVSAVLALATSQVNAIPQVIGTPDAVALFYSDCATSSQAGIPAQDQVLEPTDSTCYTFAFEGVDQAFTATGFQGDCLPFRNLIHCVMLIFISF